jgi:hypothetical protein
MSIMKTIIQIMAVAVIFTSCEKASINGSGTTTTESRNVTAFTGVQAEGSTDVDIVKGTRQKVEVSGYKNLVTIYETQVHNGILVLKFRNDFNNIRNNNITVRIEVPQISSAGLNGSGNLSVRNFTGNSLTSTVNGSGKLALLNLTGSELSSTINGSGDVTATNCSYNQLYARVSGSGKIKAAQILSDNAEASISGSGIIELTASQKLKARISGSGEIRYYGNPTATDVDVSGSGKVKRL